MNEAAQKTWLEAYISAWEGQDAEAAPLLFTEDGTYAWGPFVVPIRGRDEIKSAWEIAVIKNQDDIKVGYEFLAMTDDGRGIFRCWSSVIAVPTGTWVKTEGIFLVRLTNDGLCSEFREWWNEDPPNTGANEYQ